MSDHPKARNFKLRVRKHRYQMCLCVQMELTVTHVLKNDQPEIDEMVQPGRQTVLSFLFFVKKKKKLRRSSSQRGEFTKFSLQGSLVRKNKNKTERTQDLIKLLSLFYLTNVN